LRGRRLGWLALVAVLAAPRAEADEKTPASAQELFRGLAGLPGLSAHYREEKQLALLVEPVVSEGTVWFVPPGEFIRVTSKPVWSTLVVRLRSVVYTDDAGEQRLPVGKSHPARAFVQVFVNVVRGDLPAVERDFAVAFTPQTDGRSSWDLALSPRKKGFAGVRSIRIHGSGLVIASLEVVEAAGDRTVTTFDRVAISRRPSAREIAKALKRVR
jgi:Outer membrane lipoprotein carrier protein LolA